MFAFLREGYWSRFRIAASLVRDLIFRLKFVCLPYAYLLYLWAIITYLWDAGSQQPVSKYSKVSIVSIVSSIISSQASQPASHPQAATQLLNYLAT